MRLTVVAGLASIVVAACASASHSSTAPTITSITPASGPAGTAYPIELTIAGRNFADSANTVTFGPVTLKAVRSSDGGTRIVVYAPKALSSAGEVSPPVLMAGEYDVRVTSNGTASNAVKFSLTREP